MKILILNPEKDGFKLPDIHITYFKERRSGSFFPVELLLISNFLENEFEIEIVDENIDGKFKKNTEYDWVIAYTDFSTIERIKEIYTNIEKSSTRLIGVGYGISLIDDNLTNFLHIIIRSEIELVIDKLIFEMKNYSGKVAIGSSGRSSDIYPLNWKNINYKYELTPMELGRGCKFSCDFCHTPLFFPGDKLYKSDENIYKELKNIKKYVKNPIIMVKDDDFLSDFEKSAFFMKECNRFELPFIAKSSFNSLKDIELEKLSLNNSSLGIVARVKKEDKIPGDEELNLLKRIVKLKFRVELIIILGFDGDNNETLKKWLSFIEKAPLLKICVIPIIPLPNTPFFIEKNFSFKKDEEFLLNNFIRDVEFTLKDYFEFIEECKIVIKDGLSKIKALFLDNS